MPIGYRFDGFSGRLVGSSNKAAYNPQAFRPVEPMPITKMSPSERAVPVRTIADMKSPVQAAKVIPQTEIFGKFPDNPAYRRLQEWQRRMSKPDGKLIWQKLPRDVAGYKVTVALCALGSVLYVKTIYDAAYGKKE